MQSRSSMYSHHSDHVSEHDPNRVRCSESCKRANLRSAWLQASIILGKAVTALFSLKHAGNMLYLILSMIVSMCGEGKCGEGKATRSEWITDAIMHSLRLNITQLTAWIFHADHLDLYA